MKKKSTYRLAYAAMLTALSMIFSYVEAMIPFSFGIPGVKLGLANLVVLTGLYFLPHPQVFVILLARIVLVSFLFGNMSAMLYSLAGGILSFCVMRFVYKRKGFSIIGVSIAGGVSHNIGQITVAALVVESWSVLLYYLPFLMIAGMLTGMLIGAVGHHVMPVLRKTTQNL